MPTFSFVKSAIVTIACLLPAQSGLLAQTAGNDCNAEDQAWMDSWFPHDTTPEPAPVLSSDSLCAFHVWSTQMFLWLTQTDPATQNMRLLDMTPIDEMFDAAAGAKKTRAEAPLQLRPRLSKANEVGIGEINQAGSSGILVDHAGRVVYYEQLFNDAFVSFVRETFFTGGVFDPTLMAAATGTADFFPAGVMELKSSWRVMQPGDTGYLTTQAEVYALKNVDGKIVVDPTTTLPVTVGLVGLHIAGTVQDHPEMIWATFEHNSNSPVLPTGMSPTSTDAVSQNNYTFYTAGTPANQSNIYDASTLTLNEETQVLSPKTQVFLQFDHGIPVGAKDGDVNAADIDYINAYLAKNLDGSSDNTQYYSEIGAIWMTPNSLEPDQFPITQLRGSTMLSNATMETFTQNGAQCFSCHNTLPQFETINGSQAMLPGTNFNISHALVGEYFRSLAAQQGLSGMSLR